MSMPLLAALALPVFHRVDRGVLLLVAALFLASILAHRYWRAVIRLEDEGEARLREMARSLERYRSLFRVLPHPAAFVDRATGLVVEAAPGWVEAGLPPAGSSLAGPDGALGALWDRIPPPDEAGRPGEPLTLDLGGRSLRAEPLGGPSLGLVLLVQR